ncbi:hypothetical protein FB45DRAFT_890218 [Roridomyces roridus]|uniref:Protein kinase domain-containing protein n=1 Tax=Roridomyces roridus TaxID=1738132 RepID=A0AAD7CKS6_9AGAR|nr:hypothetical protein FB45DRAFT_890218 [Roridomyces roridus]
MYTAKIREQSEKSVILYEGENAEEECQKYIAKHANVWHPNIMQIFGVSGLRGKHIVIAQDSLIPHWEYFALHRLSVILQVYLYALWISDRHDVSEYFLDNIINEGSSMSNPHWIRRSTGRLTVDLESSRIYTPPSWYTYERVHLDWNWHDCFEESQVFEVLSIPHFHRIAIKEFSNYRFLPLENQQNVTDIRLGAVLFSPLGTTGIRELVEVAFLPDLAMIEHELWIAVHPLSETMEDGWRR